jgi:probable HAF family extracellular repeat protein
MTELELLPGGRSGSALGVNAAGVVVGVCETADQASHAVVWRAGRVSDLGTLGGSNSQAVAVNADGVLAGWSETVDGSIKAFIWQSERMTALGSLGGSRTFATAINDRGWVVGCSSTAGEVMHAFLWRDGQMLDLGTLVPGEYQTARAHDLDNDGRIVGEATVDNMNTVPVVWRDGRIHQLTERHGRAVAISGRGEVTGCLSSGTEFFVWAENDLTISGPAADSKTLQAQGIDLAGRVIGFSERRAFIWHHGEFKWLPGIAATDISDNGAFVVGSQSTGPTADVVRPVLWNGAEQTT